MVMRGCAILLAGCAALGLAAGCGGTDEGDTGTSTSAPAVTATSTNSTPGEDPNAAPGQVFTPDPTIVDAHPIPFTSWTRVADDRIAVHFQTGVPECFGVDATVTETDTTVTVELREGTRADAVDKMCVMMAVFGTLEVQLKAPLGGRQVVSAV